MKLLLDTHIWVWSVLDRARLAPRVAALLEADDTELWLSPISVWELLLLVERGRLAYDRFLAATAKVFELTLVSADAQLLKTKGVATLPNR